MSGKSTHVQDFRKYAEQGAYHWNTLRPSLKTTFNPYLHARYTVALSEVEVAVPSPNAVAPVAIDLGCGDGYIASRLAERGYKVFGIEGSQTAVEMGAQLTKSLRDRVELRQGNVCATPFTDGSADLVISLDVIEHLDSPESMLAEIKRIAKAGAKVLIGTPIRFTEGPLDRYHTHEFFSEELAELLRKYFDVISIKRSHPVEYIALMRKKFNVLGLKRNFGWNLINLYCLVTGRNPLADAESEFPTYQLAVCTVRK